MECFDTYLKLYENNEFLTNSETLKIKGINEKIGLVHHNKGDYPKALEYYERSL